MTQVLGEAMSSPGLRGSEARAACMQRWPPAPHQLQKALELWEQGWLPACSTVLGPAANLVPRSFQHCHPAGDIVIFQKKNDLQILYIIHISILFSRKFNSKNGWDVHGHSGQQKASERG